MHTGELYLPNDDEIIQDQIKKLDRLYDFNMTPVSYTHLTLPTTSRV